MNFITKRWFTKQMAPDTGAGEGFNPDALAAVAGPDERPLSERIMAFAPEADAQHIRADVADEGQDAAASKADAAGADQQGKQGETADKSDGLDTTADDADPDADQDEEEDGGADDSDQKEHEEKGTKKRTFAERVAEVAQKEVERILSEKEKVQAAEKADWTPIDQEKVDAFIAETESKIDELRLEGKYSEARKLSRQLDQLDADLEANEAKRQAWEKRQTSKKAETDNVDAQRKEIDDVSEMFRVAVKTDVPTWTKMGKWFESTVLSDPLLLKEFQDTYARQGAVGAVRFAYKYTIDNMGKEAKEAVAKKETTKTKAAAVTATTTSVPNTGADLKKAQATFAADPSPENFAMLQAEKRKARAA